LQGQPRFIFRQFRRYSRRTVKKTDLIRLGRRAGRNLIEKEQRNEKAMKHGQKHEHNTAILTQKKKDVTKNKERKIQIKKLKNRWEKIR